MNGELGGGMKPEDWQSVSSIVDEIEYSSKRCSEVLAIDAGNNSVRNFSKKMFCAFALYNDGESIKSLYITKSVPPHQIKGQENSKYASYYSPMGRIASLDPGEMDEITIPMGFVDVELLKKNEFVTITAPNKDAISNKFSTRDEIYTFSSAKASLKEYVGLTGLGSDLELPEDISIQLFKSELLDEYYTDEIVEFNLREQIVLDSIQDKVLRTAKQTRVLLNGPPGTGKSTTLIKKISFLLNRESTEDNPYQSWILFTPNPLFSSYIKEAMGFDGLPATQETVQEWAIAKAILARDVFHYIGPNSKDTNSHKVRLVYDGEVRDDNSKKLFEFLRNEVAASINKENENIANALKAIKLSIASVVRPGRDILGQHGDIFVDRTYNTIHAPLRNIYRFAETLAHSLDYRSATPKDALKHVLVSVYSSISDGPAEFKQLFIAIRDDITKYLSFLIQTGLVAVADLPDGISLRDFKLEDLLKQRGFSYLESQLNNAADSHNKNCALLALAVMKTVGGILGSWFLGRPSFYYKHTCDAFCKFKSFTVGDESVNISGLELDVLLSFGIEYLSARLESDKTASQYGGKFSKFYRDIVAIDEFSDFAPVEIYCMTNLVRPGGTILISGDLLQRSTQHGIQKLSSISKIVRNLEIYNFFNVYRMAEPICKIASAIYFNHFGEKLNYQGRHRARENRSFAPVRFMSSEHNDLLSWISGKIIELYMVYSSLPSLAVLCASEGDCLIAHDILKHLLAEHAIDIVYNPNADNISSINSVRVFKVSDIKGLEFEGVFLFDLNKIHSLYGQLSENYIYIASTRASRFLGITLTGEFPQPLQYLSEFFAIA